MTTQTQNTTTQSNEYYDVHVNGFAYLSRIREVKPVNGQRFVPFYSVTIAFCRGKVNPNKEAGEQREYTYVDCTIVNKDVCEVLKPYMDSINRKDSSVYGVFTVGDIYPEAYTSDGEVKASIKGRLVGMKSLSVNGELVYSKSVDDLGEQQAEEAPASEGTNEPAAQAEEPVQEAPVADENLEPEVSLDVNDPNFEARKTELKELGYKWSSAKKLWVLPTAA
ncbi:MAG: DUF3577 domain-containing protein [Hydrogenovibrio sp.]